MNCPKAVYLVQACTIPLITLADPWINCPFHLNSLLYITPLHSTLLVLAHAWACGPCRGLCPRFYRRGENPPMLRGNERKIFLLAERNAEALGMAEILSISLKGQKRTTPHIMWQTKREMRLLPERVWKSRAHFYRTAQNISKKSTIMQISNAISLFT